MKSLRAHLSADRLPSALLHLGGGVLLGIFLHYLLYRFSLPIAPFIYVAF